MRQKGDTPDRAVARIAGRQRGVISSRQLRSAGLSESGIARRVRAGRLHRIHRGVYAVGHAALTAEGRWLAALLACGNDLPAGDGDQEPSPGAPTRPVLSHWGAALSHRSAAALWQLLPSRDRHVDLSIPGTGGKRAPDGVHVHRSRTLSAELVTSRQGLPVTTPARTIADLRLAAKTRGCPSIVSGRELRRAIRQAEILGLTTGAEAMTRRTRSDLELEFLAICDRHALPPPVVNVAVGRYLVDFLWRDRRLIAETDSYLYHRGRVAFEDDHDRDLKLRELGFQVLRFSEKQLEREPARVAAALETALGEGQPAPPRASRLRSGRSG